MWHLFRVNQKQFLPIIIYNEDETYLHNTTNVILITQNI